MPLFSQCQIRRMRGRSGAQQQISAPPTQNLWTNRLLCSCEGANPRRLVLAFRGLGRRVRESENGGRKALVVSEPERHQDWQFWLVERVADTDRAARGSVRRACNAVPAEPYPRSLHPTVFSAHYVTRAVAAPASATVRRFERGCGPADRLGMRHTLEDGVANAEASSSRKVPQCRVYEFSRRTIASARSAMVTTDPALAPKTDASSKYCVTGLQLARECDLS